MDSIWVFGDQLNRDIGALAAADPARDRILLVESRAKLGDRRHRQRIHLVVTAMRRFADELAAAGFSVDLRVADDLRSGLEAHRQEYEPSVVRCTEPTSRAARALVGDHDVESVRSNQFLCHESDFAAWVDERGGTRLRMEDFYRWQRTRLGYLMDGDEPTGGRWNLDDQNREPPPDDVAEDDRWPTPVRSRLDDVDRDVLDQIGDAAFGDDPSGWWPTSRRAALARLRHFVDDVLPAFGPHQDAMTGANWHLAHSLLSPALNIGLLLPGEVCDAVEERYHEGGVPMSSAEGFIRQVIGWREYVWGLYWLWASEYADSNHLGADRDLPPAYLDPDATEMRCLSVTVGHVRQNGWAHHIERLMVLANIANLVGVRPQALLDWRSRSFVDAADWVMVPNVIGMGLWADGGRMATKPYVSGGAYVNRMSDHCGGCRFDPRKRTGDDACPLTTLYWDFLASNRGALEGNHRMARPLANLDRLSDVPAVRERAAGVLERIATGDL